MSKSSWVKKIKEQMQANGMSEESLIPYESVIVSLAEILEQRDKTKKEFKDTGGLSVIMYTNKGGSTNMTKNPLLVLWDDLNKSALAYWRELGLTPSSYKKLTGDAPKVEKKKGLAQALASLEGD